MSGWLRQVWAGCTPARPGELELHFYFVLQATPFSPPFPSLNTHVAQPSCSKVQSQGITRRVSKRDLGTRVLSALVMLTQGRKEFTCPSTQEQKVLLAPRGILLGLEKGHGHVLQHG